MTKPKEVSDPIGWHYVIVRDDLPRGVLAAQIVHAAGESTAEQKVATGTHAVVLSAKSEESLLSIAERLTKADIKHVCIREPDSPWFGASMAIGVFPVRDRRKLRRVLSQLPLLK